MKTWVFQFTIRSFVVWISVICLVLGNIVTGAMLLRSQQELKRAERETGFLVYDDKSKIHVTRVPVPGRGVWQFRVHLPEGRQYRLCWKLNEISKAGIPAVSDFYSHKVDPCDLTVSYFLHEEVHGEYRLEFEVTKQFANGRVRSQIFRGHTGLGDDNADWVHARKHSESSPVGTISTFDEGKVARRHFVFNESGIPNANDAGSLRFESDDTIELLRLRATEVKLSSKHPNPPGIDDDVIEKAAEFPDEADGIMFWIEPVPANQADGTRQANN